MSIYSNERYHIIVLTDDSDEFCYGVVNNVYSAIEHKTYTLPAAMQVADALNAELEKLTTKDKAPVVAIRDTTRLN